MDLKMNDKLSSVWDQLVEKIEGNPGIWEKPWFLTPDGKGIFPVNHQTGKKYHGYNRFSLEVYRIAGGFSSNHWITFNQCKSMGGNVLKGSKGTPIIVFSPPVFKDEITESGEKKEIMVRAPYFGSAYVFNVEQTTLKDDSVKVPDNGLMTIEEVEQMIGKTGAIIKEQIGDRAYYSPGLDQIVLPHIKQFKDLPSYYGTKFHELIHWTGHESRLNRLNKSASFGTGDYSREELTAEIGAVFLKAETGISDGKDNAAAYIKGWWSKIKNDKGSLIDSCGKAQKACNYILSGGPNHG